MKSEENGVLGIKVTPVMRDPTVRGTADLPDPVFAMR